MAYKEPNKIIASSKDNFLIFNNNNYTEAPYVTFTVNGGGGGMLIRITDENDENFALEILGSPGISNSSASYNTSGTATQVMFQLMECIKLNNIFFNVTLINNNTFKADIDTTRKYVIETTPIGVGGTISIGGTYTSYTSTPINKYVVMINGTIDNNTTQLVLEKYNNNNTISFNITSPFRNIHTLYPFKVKLLSYYLYNNQSNLETINNNELLILPTTINKFSDIDYDDYFLSSSDNLKKLPLTNNLNRYYNYDEVVAFSFLSEVENLTIKKNYYTVSGMYITSTNDIDCHEFNNNRHDFYLNLKIDSIESNYNYDVGYVEVIVMKGQTEVSYSIRYNVNAKCNINEEIYFLNEIGGVDSFNFNNEKNIITSINNKITYTSTLIDDYTNVKELTKIRKVNNKITYTLLSFLINYDTSLWLNELSKSEYTFKLDKENFIKELIIIDKLDININNNTKQYEVEITYQKTDNYN